MKLTKDSADKVEKYGYTRKFSHEELSEMKNNLSERSIERNDLEIELKELSKDYKSAIEKKKKAIKGLLKNLKHKAEYVEIECFVEFNQETGFALFYDAETGENVGSRPLTPAERQSTIFTEIRKEGTNN
jgi:hypothetical protein